MKYFSSLFICITTILTLMGPSGCSQRIDSNSNITEAWNKDNDPLKLGAGYERRYSALPREAELGSTPWADSYWPTFKGGISLRADEKIQDDANYSWNYETHTIAELKKMSKKELRKLSPAEKLDIVNDDFEYTLLNYERERTSPDRPKWEGLCHGWAVVSLSFKEPKPILFKAKNGLEIPFGSSDIKALITYNQAIISSNRGKLNFLGKRCDADFEKEPERANDPDCKGVNAGTFHLILTNFIAIKKQGFVANISRNKEVWNHPVFGFNSKQLWVNYGHSEDAAPGTVKEITVETEMIYRVESVPTWKRTGDDPYYTSSKIYKYRLEINRKGEIIGGTWLTEDRPSFFWTEEIAPLDINPLFKVVKDIYSQATNTSVPTPSSTPSTVMPDSRANSPVPTPNAPTPTPESSSPVPTPSLPGAEPTLTPVPSPDTPTPTPSPSPVPTSLSPARASDDYFLPKIIDDAKPEMIGFFKIFVN